MKNLFSLKLSAVAVAAGLSACVATAYAARIMRDPNETPDPTLPQAYEKAIEALGPKAEKFHCVTANALARTDTAGPTEWHCEFYSKSGFYREVIVSTKDKVIVRNHPIEDY